MNKVEKEKYFKSALQLSGKRKTLEQHNPAKPYNVHYTHLPINLNFTLCTMYMTLYNMYLKIYTIHYTLYTSHFALHTIH